MVRMVIRMIKSGSKLEIRMVVPLLQDDANLRTTINIMITDSQRRVERVVRGSRVSVKKRQPWRYQRNKLI